MAKITIVPSPPPPPPPSSSLLPMSLLSLLLFSWVATYIIHVVESNPIIVSRFDRMAYMIEGGIYARSKQTKVDTILTFHYPWKRNKEDNKKDEPKKKLYSRSCEMYLAESTIHQSGLGLYTGKSIHRFDRVGPMEIGILLSDLESHIQQQNQQQKQSNQTYGQSTFHFYPWSGWVLPQAQFETNKASLSAIPGLGMAANAHPSLWNVIISETSHSIQLQQFKHDPFYTKQDEAEEDDDNNVDLDSMLGASTSYHGIHLTSQSSEVLEPGSELFMNYGDGYFMDSKLKHVPLAQNYDHANDIIRDFLSNTTSTTSSSNDDNNDDESIRDHQWKTIRSQTMQKDIRTGTALPTSIHHLPDALKQGTAKWNLLPNRSIPWLEQNGHCIDAITNAPSVIPLAGYGAYSTRNFDHVGQIITTMPLLQIDKSHLNLYSSSNNEKKKGTERQLIWNYCFGHVNSTLLLYPYTPSVNYFNHARECPNNVNKNNHHPCANARIRWSLSSSSLSSYHQSQWLHWKPKDILNQTKTGLLMDIITIRSIEVGDEILIDYGKEWHDAWYKAAATKNHNHHRRRNYRNLANGLNSNPSSIIRTILEQTIDPYPKGIRTACYFDVKYNTTTTTTTTTMLLFKNGIKKNMTSLIFDMTTETMLQRNLRPCDILSRHHNYYYYVYNKKNHEKISSSIKQDEEDEDEEDVMLNWYYTARIYDYVGIPSTSSIKTTNTTNEDDDDGRIVSRIPRWAIRFVENPYTRPQFAPNAFRHEIGFPSGMFPESWMDLRSSS